jgi:hypothetical protein
MIMALTFTLYPVVISITDELSIENSNFAIFYDSIDFVFLTHYYFFRGSIAWRSNKQSTFFCIYHHHFMKKKLWNSVCGAFCCVLIFFVLWPASTYRFFLSEMFLYIWQWNEKKRRLKQASFVWQEIIRRKQCQANEMKVKNYLKLRRVSLFIFFYVMK